ncbi:hypothetical protein [Oleiagrimonas sp.]|jgi:ABC-type phosphate transport system substrate-binding protein|uniref:hypothetical protein n=1 Tax=Oleiagrimonas sp. TaxID=2010330 RepID=UPI00260698EF|nr:hypothetical protein [Oleiagrimonas sp.]MDA3915024.1 hypothetical protein [Oleiagrimonas sp.]
MVSNAVAKGANDRQIAIIVSRHTPVTTIDNNLLRSVFLKKIFLDPANHVYVPVNLKPDSKLRRDFTLAVIHMDEPQLQSYWNRQYFQGISPPFVLGSQTAVVDFVAKTPGAIGYVRPCYVNAKVKVILLLTVIGALADAAPEHCPSDGRH